MSNSNLINLLRRNATWMGNGDVDASIDHGKLPDDTCTENKNGAIQNHFCNEIETLLKVSYQPKTLP